MRIPIPARRAQRLLTPADYSINFSQTVHLDGEIDPVALDAALAKLAQRFPVLGARVVLENPEQGALINDDTPPPRALLVPRESETTWIEQADRWLPVRFDYANGPLFRAVLVQGGGAADLILIADHSTADGRAGLYAVRDLLRFLADPALELPAVAPPRLRDRLTDDVRSLITRLEADAPPPGPSRPWSPERASTPRHLLPFVLPVDKTSRLVSRCREHGVTVQAALCAAFLKPYADRHPEPRRRAEVPVDLRPYLQDAGDDWYSNYLTLAMIEADCSSDLWAAAADAGRSLRALTPQDLFLMPPAVWYVSDRLAPVRSFDVPYDVSISNLGRWDVPARGSGWSVTSVHAPTFNVSQPRHDIWGVNTGNGVLAATFTSRELEAPVIAREGWAHLNAMAD